MRVIVFKLNNYSFWGSVQSIRFRCIERKLFFNGLLHTCLVKNFKNGNRCKRNHFILRKFRSWAFVEVSWMRARRKINYQPLRAILAPLILITWHYNNAMYVRRFKNQRNRCFATEEHVVMGSHGSHQRSFTPTWSLLKHRNFNFPNLSNALLQELFLEYR